MNPKPLLIVTLLALAGCGPRTLAVDMNEDNDSGQEGTAVLTEQGDGRIEVVLNLSKGNATGPQSGHIHSGRCGQLGPARFPLTDAVDGQSTSVVQGTTIAELLAEPHAINIHSAADTSVYVSCGDIAE